MSTKSGELSVMFEVTKMSDDVYAIVLRPPTLFTQEHIYREKRGKVYVGAEGSKQAGSLVTELVRCAIAAIEEEEWSSLSWREPHPLLSEIMKEQNDPQTSS